MYSVIGATKPYNARLFPIMQAGLLVILIYERKFRIECKFNNFHQQFLIILKGTEYITTTTIENREPIRPLKERETLI
jgi:hypothetical protein